MDKEIAISVKNVSKTFKIPHEKISSVRGAFVGMLRGRRTFEEFKALDDVSFEVKKGEFFGIIGRNGSGKSTLLKVLAGIYQADKGKVKVNGMISPFLELGIGFNPELSGRDNVYLNATVLGMTQKEIDEKFDSIVAFSELGRFIDQKLKNYSSGMQVRLAFSVSIHANRDILLMDEVLAVGDSNFQSKCLTEFSRYKEMGKTVILVTHDIATVQRYCDRAMLLRNGSVVRLGDPEEVGNAYIFDNMSDEEKRMRYERISRVGEVEDPSGIEESRSHEFVEITGVEFFDKNGNEKNVFRAGDNFSIKVSFNSKTKLQELNFGLAIYGQGNEYVFGVNTIFDGVDIANFLSRGHFYVEIKKNPLNSGSYYILTNIVKNNFIDPPYAVRNKLDYFKIMNSSQNEGIVALDYYWK